MDNRAEKKEKTSEILFSIFLVIFVCGLIFEAVSCITVAENKVKGQHACGPFVLVDLFVYNNKIQAICTNSEQGFDIKEITNEK